VAAPQVPATPSLPRRVPMSTLRISLVLNLLLAAVCVLLLQQNRELKQGAGSAHSAGALRRGGHVVPLAYRTLSGDAATLAFGDTRERYLLFVISTTCPWCERSLPRIRSIAQRVSGHRVHPLAVSIHDPVATASFATAQHIDFELVSAASSDEFQRSYGIEGVPTTILLGGDGVVLGVWEGNITPELETEIERAAGS